MGIQLTTAVRRLLCLGALLLVSVPTVAGCAWEDPRPDMSTREAFARSVMAAATSGSVEQVERLVIPDRINVRPEAQQLLDATHGWAPESWELRLDNDFPAVANVEVLRNGEPSAVRYALSWSQERWALVMGEPRNPPSRGAGLGTGSGPPAGQAPADCSGSAAKTGAGAAALMCQQYTSTAGNAPGHNLHWLTSTPLHVSFSVMNGSAALVVRMPCGVPNVPVAVDAFGLTADPAGMVQSADGCAGAAAEQHSWTTAYFKSPLIYQLGPQELVFANELGRIRLSRD